MMVWLCDGATLRRCVRRCRTPRDGARGGHFELDRAAAQAGRAPTPALTDCARAAIHR